eukprot:CAMPEP_0185484508 /NCGR_PEP_ID=MMETSP1366-20130426/9367_1 /TAXON_ID=38817 /ORGANISM="Gephyrocapsa oceanica, Strain RCC1303" /LENGTH=53 /DNA_ID=CAMNT_0028092565 /DNA_START=25 /DNA_END=183 /DNA_ORIENTATION=-
MVRDRPESVRAISAQARRKLGAISVRSRRNLLGLRAVGGSPLGRSRAISGDLG